MMQDLLHQLHCIAYALTMSTGCQLLLLLLLQVGHEEEGVCEHIRHGGGQQAWSESAQGRYHWLCHCSQGNCFVWLAYSVPDMLYSAAMLN